MVSFSWSLDFAPLLAASLTALSCALTGCFLICSRQGLLGDAMSHAVFPGIVISFLLSGHIAPLPMLVGALLAALLAILWTNIIVASCHVSWSAALAASFSAFFALGVVLMETLVGRRVHLDVQHALYGYLEGVVWPELRQFSDILVTENWRSIPQEILFLSVILLVIIIFLRLFSSLLQIMIFDTMTARHFGIHRRGLWGAFLVMVALATVGAFQIVGVILPIAFLICPPAAARLWVKRLPSMMRLASIFALVAVIGGHIIAIWGPPLLGWPHSLNASAMMAVCSGIILVFSALWHQSRSRFINRKTRPL